MWGPGTVPLSLHGEHLGLCLTSSDLSGARQWTDFMTHAWKSPHLFPSVGEKGKVRALIISGEWGTDERS